VYCGERHGVKQAHKPIVSRQLYNQVAAGLDQRTA
jgi:hypothetical protein